MGPHVPLQLVSVSAGVAAQAALEWAFPGVRTNVAFQLANLKPKNIEGRLAMRRLLTAKNNFLKNPMSF